jgi:hypothetical protein
MQSGSRTLRTASGRSLASSLAGLLVALRATAGGPAASPSVESLVARHLEARGGRERLAAVRSLVASGRLVSGASESTFTLTWVRPDRARLELVTGPRRMIEVVTGAGAWWIAPDATPPQSGLLPPDAAREIAERGDVDGILAHWRERGYTAALGGEEEIGGERVATVDLARGGGETHRLSLSLRTSLVLRRISRWGGGGTGVEVEARFSDFRTVSGVVIPFAIERRTGGELLHRIVVERVRLDPTVDPALFVPPPGLQGALAAP